MAKNDLAFLSQKVSHLNRNDYASELTSVTESGHPGIISKLGIFASDYSINHSGATSLIDQSSPLRVSVFIRVRNDYFGFNFWHWDGLCGGCGWNCSSLWHRRRSFQWNSCFDGWWLRWRSISWTSWVSGIVRIVVVNIWFTIVAVVPGGRSFSRRVTPVWKAIAVPKEVVLRSSTFVYIVGWFPVTVRSFLLVFFEHQVIGK